MKNLHPQKSSVIDLRPVRTQEPSYLQQQEPSIDVPVRKLNFEWENPRQAPPKLEFDNAQAAFASHSSLAIARSLAVFSVRLAFLGRLPVQRG